MGYRSSTFTRVIPREGFMFRKSFWLLAALLVSAAGTISYAITNGQPDNGEHPYVGDLLFYVPDEIDSRFTDPGSWFGCSGTLISPTVVVTAGHCTYGVGLNGAATTQNGGKGGNDVWINVSEKPDLTGFPPSANYIPDRNAQRYTDRVAYLNTHPAWVRGKAYPHPEFAGGPFVLHDVGVVVLDKSINLPTYGALPPLGYLDQFFASRRNDQRFTVVGYGLTQSRPTGTEGGDTREKATSMLINLNALGAPAGYFVVLSNNNGKSHQGGTCFGDSGGPVLAGSTNVIVGVNSFVLNNNCVGTDGAYRIDQQDDLDFIGQYRR
jgi:Trypsin